MFRDVKDYIQARPQDSMIISAVVLMAYLKFMVALNRLLTENAAGSTVYNFAMVGNFAILSALTSALGYAFYQQTPPRNNVVETDEPAAHTPVLKG
jgi:hypothetical protein